MLHFESDNSITIITANKNYLIGSGDIRFPKLHKNLHSLTEEQIINICEYEFLTRNKFLTISDGQIKLKDKPISIGFAKILSQESLTGNSFDSIVNLMINLENHSELKAQKTEQLLDSIHSVPVSSDGFCFITESGEDLRDTPFYRVRDPELLALFNQGLKLEEVISYFTGVDPGKKLVNLLKKEFNDPSKEELSTQGLCFLKEFGATFSKEQYVELLQNNFHLNSPENFCQYLKFFFDTPKRIFNALLSINKNTRLLSSVREFNKIQNQITKPNTKFSFEGNKINYIFEFTKREYLRLNSQEKDLCLNRFSFIRNLTEFDIEGFKLVIPQTSHDLEMWGQLMNNCIKSRVNNAINGSLIPMALYKDDKLEYCLEFLLHSQRFGDFESYGRAQPSEQLKMAVEKFLKKNGFFEKSEY